MDAEATARPGDREERRFAGELPISFEEAMSLLSASVSSTEGSVPTVGARVRSLVCGGGEPVLATGVGQDGFRNRQFDEKMERGRRYGSVYRLFEETNGYRLEFEFPRRVPDSATKEKLSVADEMPDYAYTLELKERHLTVKGSVTDANLRRVAAVSPAFPPDFTTRIKLPQRVAGFRHRYRDKILEVALPKHLAVFAGDVAGTR